jgi:2-oxoacid:acceptor oxidoreductase gamma subunit (pyruvate/2-ketoisovalerate family)
VTGYTRISDKPISIHSHIYTPNIVIIVDPTLLGKIDATAGLIQDGTIVANTDQSPAELKNSLGVEKVKVYTVNASRIALDILGRPIYNTAMLGALARAIPLVKLESVKKVVKERFPGTVGDKNVAVIEKAYKEAKSVE